MRALCGWALALSLVACRFDDAPGADLACRGTQDCPTDYGCEATIHRCVTRRTTAFRNTVVAPARLTRGTRLTVSFELGAAPLEPPQLVLVTATSSTPLVGAPVDGTFVYQRTIDDADGEGPALVLARVRTSATEVLAAARLGEVLIDATGPRLTASSAELVPDDDHLLRQLGLLSKVVSLSEHSAWVVTLTVDEALEGPPRLELWGAGAAAPSAVSSAPSQTDGLTFTFRLRGQPLWPQGLHRLRAHLVDALGNASELAVGDLSIDVDTVAPTAPAVDTAGAVVFRREPWGSRASPGAPRFTLRGTPGALEADAVVQFFADTLAIGRARGDSSGGFEETALPLTEDRSDLTGRTVDAAGNPSAQVAVRDLEWVATPAALPGLASPISVVRRADSAPCRLLSSDEQVAGAELPDRLRAEVTTGWRTAQPPRAGPLPQLGVTTRLWFDSAAQRTMLATNASYNDTSFGQFVREPGGWRPFGGFSVPYQMALSAMAFDPANNDIVSVVAPVPNSYARGGVLRSRTRAEDPNGNAFERPSDVPRGSCGDPQYFPNSVLNGNFGAGVAAALDVRRGVMLVFGGERPFWGWDNATYESSGDAVFNDVVEVNTVGARPGARARAAMGYDRGAGRTLLFGGVAENGDLLGDTWAYSPSEGWTEVTPRGPGPAPRTEAALAWDGQRERLVLVGGRAGSRFTPDTWSWDGARWVPLGAGLSRADVSLAWDDARGELLLAGGYDSADGGTGVPRWPSGVLVLQPNGSFAPEAIDAGAPAPNGTLFLGYDTYSWGECVDPQGSQGFTYVSHVSGSSCDDNGNCGDYSDALNDLYTRSPGAAPLPSPGPGSRDRAALGVRPGGGLMVVGGETPGGLLAEAWERQPDGGWAAAPPMSTPLAAPLLAGDPSLGALILYGGEADGGALRDTWQFDGQRWSQVGTSGPSLRGGESLSYLLSERTMVLAQGAQLLALRAGAWQPAATLPLPGAGARSLGSDLSVGADLLLADPTDGGAVQLFARRDAGWEHPALSDPLREVRAGGPLGANLAGGGVLLMRGLQSPLRLEAVGLRPEVIATLDLSRLGRGKADALTSVSALAVTGGRAGARSGARLTPWFETGFFPPPAAPATQTSAPPEALQELLWRTSDPSLVLRVASRSSLSFRVQALGESDLEPARLALDYFELTLGLRRPAAK